MNNVTVHRNTDCCHYSKEAGAGVSVKEICRKHGISEATYDNWKSRDGGMNASDLKRLEEMEQEFY